MISGKDYWCMDYPTNLSGQGYTPTLFSGLPCIVLFALLSLPVHAVDVLMDSEQILSIGIIGHDQGPFSDHNEHGIDLNLEVQSAPLELIGAPRFHLGTTLNFSGSTSVIYAGLNFPVYAIRQWHLEGAIGVASHNGPLHKDPMDCALNSDCGFGTRFLPRLGVDIVYRLDYRSAISLLFDHMSHKWVISGENEGLDHAGLRYLHAF